MQPTSHSLTATCVLPLVSLTAKAWTGMIFNTPIQSEQITSPAPPPLPSPHPAPPFPDLGEGWQQGHIYTQRVRRVIKLHPVRSEYQPVGLVALRQVIGLLGSWVVCLPLPLLLQGFQVTAKYQLKCTHDSGDRINQSRAVWPCLKPHPLKYVGCCYPQRWKEGGWRYKW